MKGEESKSGDGAPGQPDSPLSTPHSSPLTHSIRLGPPWQLTSVEGGTQHTRKFGRPRTLDATEGLWLVCERLPGPAEVRVNGTPLPATDAPGPFAADITPLLLPRNEVLIVVSSNEPLGAVWLEVRPA